VLGLGSGDQVNALNIRSAGAAPPSSRFTTWRAAPEHTGSPGATSIRRQRTIVVHSMI
jgi:hypothetical protein